MTTPTTPPASFPRYFVRTEGNADGEAYARLDPSGYAVVVFTDGRERPLSEDLTPETIESYVALALWKEIPEAEALALVVPAPMASQAVPIQDAAASMPIRQLQAVLPWTVPYSPELEASRAAEPHRYVLHCLAHLQKSIGKIADQCEASDHNAAHRWEDVRKHVASLVMCALRIANVWPGGKFDLADMLADTMNGKNGGDVRTAVAAELSKPMASQAEASDSPASRSMGWVEAQKLADEALRLADAATEGPWRCSAIGSTHAPNGSAIPLDGDLTVADGSPLMSASEYLGGEGFANCRLIAFAREALPALARLVKSLPPPPGQEAPATSPQDSRFANPKSEISPLAFVPHGKPCTLAECPPGPFVYHDKLGLRTAEHAETAFDVESGKPFVEHMGGMVARYHLTVQPVRPAPVSSSASPSPEVIAEAVEALRPFADFAAKFNAKPLRGIDDTLYAIHTGTQWEAEIRLSDLFRARAILPKLKAQQQHAPQAKPQPAPSLPNEADECTPFPTGDLRLLLKAIGNKPVATFRVNTPSLKNIIRELLHRREQPAPSLVGMTVRYIQPGEDGKSPELVTVSIAEAVRQSRAAFKQAKPDATDPRSDLEALEDYATVHWANLYAPAPSLVKVGEPLRLADCPPGLFECGESLGFKSLFGLVYSVETANVAWFEAKDNDALDNLIVQPVTLSAQSPQASDEPKGDPQ